MTWIEYFKWKDPCYKCLMIPVCKDACGERNKFTYMRPAVLSEKKKEIFYYGTFYVAALSLGIAVSTVLGVIL